MVDRVVKLSAGYGPRWEKTTALRYATVLVNQEGFAEVALAQARRAERMLTDSDEASTRLEVLESLVACLQKSKKADEATAYTTQITKLMVKDYQEYKKTNPPFPVTAFAGVKKPTGRVAVVEFFSGADFGPSAAFDLARDAVVQAYQPTDVVVLDYHVHLGGVGDPLTAPENLERFAFYGDAVRRGGLGLVNGKPGPRAKQEMSAANSKEVFEGLQKLIEEQLEKPADVKLTLTAGPKFNAKVQLPKAEEKLVLRFAVVEEQVRYAGANGVRYHHQIVRAMPGGSKGFAIKGTAIDESVEVKVDAIRANLAKSLDDYAKDGEFPRADRPLALQNLAVIAFVQNDATMEILAAARVPLTTK
ncbi:MAG: hypothetical protein ACRCZF_09040, partial [Gemmataceae bacterium]